VGGLALFDLFRDVPDKAGFFVVAFVPEAVDAGQILLGLGWARLG